MTHENSWHIKNKMWLVSEPWANITKWFIDALWQVFLVYTMHAIDKSDAYFSGGSHITLNVEFLLSIASHFMVA